MNKAIIVVAIVGTAIMENDDVVDGARKDWKLCQERYKEYVASGCN